MIAAKENIRLQKIITLIAIVLFLVKLAAWYLTGSLAILTDALESIVNIVSGFLGLYSLYLSAKPKDADHPYGHGKVEFISAALKELLLLLQDFLLFTNLLQAFFILTRLKNWIMELFYWQLQRL